MTKIEIENAEQILEHSKVNNKVFLKFYSKTCSPCKVMESVIDGISDALGEITILNVDSVEHFEIAKEYGVLKLPCLIKVEYNGIETVTSNYTGAPANKETLKEFFNA